MKNVIISLIFILLCSCKGKLVVDGSTPAKFRESLNKIESQTGKKYNDKLLIFNESFSNITKQYPLDTPGLREVLDGKNLDEIVDFAYTKDEQEKLISTKYVTLMKMLGTYTVLHFVDGTKDKFQSKEITEKEIFSKFRNDPYVKTTSPKAIDHFFKELMWHGTENVKFDGKSQNALAEIYINFKAIRVFQDGHVEKE